MLGSVALLTEARFVVRDGQVVKANNPGLLPPAPAAIDEADASDDGEGGGDEE
jgi:hypothetical protein